MGGQLLWQAAYNFIQWDILQRTSSKFSALICWTTHDKNHQRQVIKNWLSTHLAHVQPQAQILKRTGFQLALEEQAFCLGIINEFKVSVKYVMQNSDLGNTYFFYTFLQMSATVSFCRIKDGICLRKKAKEGSENEDKGIWHYSSFNSFFAVCKG